MRVYIYMGVDTVSLCLKYGVSQNLEVNNGFGLELQLGGGRIQRIHLPDSQPGSLELSKPNFIGFYSWSARWVVHTSIVYFYSTSSSSSSSIVSYLWPLQLALLLNNTKCTTLGISPSALVCIFIKNCDCHPSLCILF